MVSIITLFLSLLRFVTVVGTTDGSNLILRFSISEELPSGTVVGNVHKEAQIESLFPAEVLPKLRFHFLNQAMNSKRYFNLDSRSGILRTAQKIDREAIQPRCEECKITLDIALSPSEHFKVIHVLVNIMDINDHSPVFPEERFHLFLSEAAPVGTKINLSPATDPDFGLNGIKEYKILDPLEEFKVYYGQNIDGTANVYLTLLSKVDRETRGFYQFLIAAEDGGIPAKSGTATVSVTIQDANDNPPRFFNDSAEISVKENVKLTRNLYQVKAVDADEGQNCKIRYSFTSNTIKLSGHLFNINQETGQVFVTGKLDREKKNQYKLVVKATDSGPDPKTAYFTLRVNVLDVNDNVPVIKVITFGNRSDEVHIPENKAPGEFVAYVYVHDPDNGVNGRVSCSVNDDRFHIENGTNFEIKTARKLDREEDDVIELRLICRDHGFPQRTADRRVRVVVLDMNDNPPLFSRPRIEVKVKENNKPGQILAYAKATDADKGENATIKYSQSPSTGASECVSVDPSTGAITATGGFDYEINRTVSVLIVATDGGVPGLSSTCTVIINIQDENDNKPVFINQKLSYVVPENEAPDTLVGTVKADDADTTHPYNIVVYTIPRTDQRSSCCFKIDASSGQIRTTAVLDREVESVYYLTIIASNTAPPGGTTSLTLSIHVGDVNDNQPVFDYPTINNATLYITNNVSLKSHFAQLRARDADLGKNAVVSYNFLRTDNHPFKMDAESGKIYANMDLVGRATYILTVRACDQGKPPLSSYASLTVVMYRTKGPKSPSGARTHLYGEVPSELPSSSTEGENYLLIIAVGAAAVILMLILSAVIIFIKCQDHRKRHVSYKQAATGSDVENAGRVGHRSRTCCRICWPTSLLCAGSGVRDTERNLSDCHQQMTSQTIDQSRNSWATNVTLSSTPPLQIHRDAEISSLQPEGRNGRPQDRCKIPSTLATPCGRFSSSLDGTGARLPAVSGSSAHPDNVSQLGSLADSDDVTTYRTFSTFLDGQKEMQVQELLTMLSKNDQSFPVTSSRRFDESFSDSGQGASLLDPSPAASERSDIIGRHGDAYSSLLPRSSQASTSV